MAAKQNKDLKNIDYELNKLEEKVKEFQDYLSVNTVITKVKDAELKEASENQQLRHREIEVQIKMVDALFKWLPVLKVLRDGDTAEKKDIETRGDTGVSGLYKRGKE